MKRILAVLIIGLAGQSAQASDREVFGAIAGAVIGYHIMKATEPRVVYVPQNPVYVDNRSHRMIDLRHPQPQSSRCWNRLDRINQYGQPIWVQECNVN